MIIIDAAATIVGGRGRPVDDTQAGDGNVFARGNVKDAAGMVGVNGQAIGPRTADSDALVHEQFAAGQRDCLAVQRRIEVNRIAVECVRNRLAQRARTVVVMCL